MRIFQATTLMLALAAAGAASAADAPKSGLTEPQVRTLLTEQGYTKIDDIDFENGMWEADATSANGKRTDVRVDPASGQVYAEAQVSNLSENDIKAKLAAAGYSKVHDVDFDDGLWQAKAERQDGKNVEVHLSPKDGSVLHVEND
ncbi:MAG: PepSY domain-containing protein [Pseudoxanthomonas sp.]